MKSRKTFFLMAFLLAIVASFAFTGRKNFHVGYYYDSGTQCVSGLIDQNFCSPTQTGPQCTITVGGEHNPAYASVQGSFTCLYPYYLPKP